MMNNRIFVLSLLAFTLVGCDFKKDEPVENTPIERLDTQETEIVEEKSIVPQTFETLEHWKSYYQNNVSGFNPDDFKKENSYKITPEQSNIKPIWDKDFKPVYKNFLKFNPDSTQYVDFMSYKLQFDDHNEVILGADQEIVLVDIPTKKMKRLLTYGASFWVEDAFFKNDSILVLLENSTDKLPAYQEINIKTNQADYYIYNQNINFDSNYLKEKLLSIYKISY